VPRLVVVVAVSYLLGCAVAGYYLVRALRGGDVRLIGSGNAGARNVQRVHGRGIAAVTLLADAGKAALAVAVARLMLHADWAAPLALVMVIAGHVWPVQLGFRGGKGAASAAGGFLAMDPTAAAIALSVGLVLLLVTRRFTASGLAAVAVAPITLAVLQRGWAVTTLTAVAMAIVLAAHTPRADARRRAVVEAQR